MDPAPEGWTRYLMKSKFGAGRDFQVTDTDEQLVYVLDGKMGARPKADIDTADGSTVYRVHGHLLGVPKQITISTADGTDVA